MFVNKLICDKCGTEVNASDKYCRECGTAGYKDYVRAKEEPKIKLPNSLDELIKESARCKSCGKLLSPYSSHMCPGLVHKPIDIRWDVNETDVKFGPGELDMMVFTNK